MLIFVIIFEKDFVHQIKVWVM